MGADRLLPSGPEALLTEPRSSKTTGSLFHYTEFITILIKIVDNTSNLFDVAGPGTWASNFFDVAGPGTWEPLDSVPLFGSAALSTQPPRFTCNCFKNCAHYTGSDALKKYRCTGGLAVKVCVCVCVCWYGGA